MGKRARHADPHPSNVQIATPPGHRLTVVSHEPNRTTAICQCGWRSKSSLPRLESLQAYDAHLDVFGEWCDFCSGLWPIVKEYDCPEFSIDFGTVNKKGEKEIFVYHGAWLACGTCSKLIDEDKWAELASRTVEGTFFADSELGVRAKETLLTAFKESPEYQALTDRIVYLHQMFQRVRTQ